MTRRPSKPATIGGIAPHSGNLCGDPLTLLTPAASPPDWALETEVKDGDVLIADAGFTCLDEGQRCTVITVRKLYHLEELAVECRSGTHCLDGQLDEQGRYVGFTLAAPEAAR